MTPRAMLAGA